MACAQPRHSPSSLSSVRQGIYRATDDPDLAERVFGLVVASRSPPIGVALPWMASTPSTADLSFPRVVAWSAVDHVAYDLCVVLAYVLPGEADRARDILGPADWSLVQRIGGWGELHQVAPHYRRRHLIRALDKHLRWVGTDRPIRRTRPLRVARKGDLAPLLEQMVRSHPQLGALSVFDLSGRKISLGATAYLMDRLASASEGWAAERVRRSWFVLLARCPTVEDSL